jgi:RNA polymerase sigma-70 factor (ECF subfamily)
MVAAKAHTSEGERDDQLLAAAGGGDRRAFAALVRSHSERAFALALRFTGNAADADDIVQEAFWRVWRSAADWKPGRARFSTWLYRVVYNLCVDHARRRRIRRLLPFDDSAEQAQDDNPGPDRQVMSRDRLSSVRSDIVELPPRQRAALLMSVVQGMANAEIAEVLGVSEGAAEQALVRARRRLREKLQMREDEVTP